MNNSFFTTLMALIIEKSPFVRHCCDQAKVLDFLAPLLLRLYLAPVLWMAGTRKFSHFTETAEWFGATDTGLGLPAPYVLVFLVALIETLGAVFLLFGFATRLISVPLMAIMLAAGYLVHLQNGWLAIAAGAGLFATERTRRAMERLDQATGILQSQGDYAYLTENGGFAMLNNGVEFAATYFIMLLVLFFSGGGRFVSADYWLARRYLGG